MYDVNPMYGGRIVQDKLWFYSTYRQTGGKSTVPGLFWNKNAGDPTKWIVDFDRSKPAFYQQGGAPGDAPADVAGDAAQQVQRALVRAVPRLELRRGGRRRDGRHVDDARSDAAVVLHPVPSTDTPRGRRRSQAGCWPRPAGACIRPGTASRNGTTAPTFRG